MFVGSQANVINLSKDGSNIKNSRLIDLFKKFGSLISLALNYNISEYLDNNTQNLIKSNETDPSNETKKVLLKSVEKLSESKILALDLLSIILSCFLKGNYVFCSLKKSIFVKN